MVTLLATALTVRIQLAATRCAAALPHQLRERGGVTAEWIAIGATSVLGIAAVSTFFYDQVRELIGALFDQLQP